jgi:O-antigen/teichoic acid export membrane protein
MTESGRRSLHEVAVRGGAWSLAQVVANKLTSLVGTFILMYLLVPGDYATASLALSAQALLTVLPATTLGDALIARSMEADRLMGTAFRVCAAVSLITTVVLAAAGPLAASTYEDRGLVLAFGCVAFRPLVELALLGPQTRLRIKMAFKQLSVIDAITQGGATVLSVIMAATGWGWWSLLVPQIVSTGVRAAAAAVVAGPAPPGPRWIPEEAARVTSAYALSGLGQYVHGGLLMLPPLVIGWFADKTEVGYFSMAFTLSASINVVVAVSMGLVIQPIFASMAGDHGRQLAAFTRSCSVIAAVSMPLCLLQAAIVGPAIRTCLPERWAGAVDLAVVMSFGQAFYFAVNPAMGLLKAQGRFVAFMVWQGVQLVFVGALMVMAGMVFPESATIAITALASLYTVVSSPFGVWLCLRGSHGAMRRSLLLFARPFLAAALAIVPAWILVDRMGDGGLRWQLTQMIAIPVIGLMAYAVLLYAFDRAAAEECLRLARIVGDRIGRRRVAG